LHNKCESKIPNNAEGSCCGLFEVLSQNILRGTDIKHKNIFARPRFESETCGHNAGVTKLLN
jgi:hypothetical protein